MSSARSRPLKTLLFALVCSAGCHTSDEMIASGTRGYLDACETSASCSTGLSCEFGVCTHSCNEPCTGGASCVDEVGVCLPPEIAATLRADAGVDMGTPAADGGVDMSTPTPDGSVVARPLVACTDSTSFDTTTTRFVGLPDVEQVGDYSANFMRSFSVVKPDGSTHVVFVTGGDPRDSSFASVLVGTYYAAFIEGAWTTPIYAQPSGLDFQEATMVLDGPGRDIYVVMRDNDCWNGLSCSTALVRLRAGDPEPVLDLNTEIFSILGDEGDPTDPYVMHGEVLPSGDIRLFAINTRASSNSYDPDLASFHTVTLSPSGDVLSRKSFPLRSPSLGALQGVEGVSNLGFHEDGTVSFVVTTRTNARVYFRATPEDHTEVTGVDLALSRAPASSSALLVHDASGDDFSVIHETCSTMGAEYCMVYSIVREHVAAITGIGSSAEVITTRAFAEGGLANPLFDMEAKEATSLLLEIEGTQGPLPPSRLLRGSGATYTDQSWSVPTLDIGTDAEIYDHGNQLLISNGQVYGAMQFAIVAGGPYALYPVVAFRGCH